MGLYKEADHAFSELDARQVRIYPDACDTGIKVSGVDDPLCLKVKQMLADDFLMGGIKLHRNLFDYGASHGVLVKFLLPWEKAEGERNKFCGTEWHIMYTEDRVRKVKFISLIAFHAVWGGVDIWKKEQ